MNFIRKKVVVIGNTKVTIVDAMCGSGKTTWAIQNINANPERSIIYCTPFLDEIDRVKRATQIGLVEPEFRDGRKLNDFNDLIAQGKNVAVSHATFTNATEETYYNLRCGDYTLIMDEEVNVLMDFNEAVVNKIKQGDVRIALEKGLIEVDAYGRVHWIAPESYLDSSFSDVERMAKQENLFCLDGKFLVWAFPVEVFQTFEHIYVLTYMFKGSILKGYFEYYNIDYELVNVENIEGEYVLTSHTEDLEDRKRFKELITIWDDNKANSYAKGALNARWYREATESDLTDLKNHLQRFFKNYCNAKAARILWTSKKGDDEKYKKALSVNGCRRVRNLTKEERDALSTENVERLERKLSCYAPLNCRGVNDYGDRDALAYLYNFYPHPNADKFFSRKNRVDGTNICLDKNYYALAQMIQWIWRSAIRNGKPITIYIPSERMRMLLIRWLDAEL